MNEDNGCTRMCSVESLRQSLHQVWTLLNFSPGDEISMFLIQIPSVQAGLQMPGISVPGEARGRCVETVRPHTMPRVCQSSATPIRASSTYLLSLFTLLLSLLHYHHLQNHAFPVYYLVTLYATQDHLYGCTLMETQGE